MDFKLKSNGDIDLKEISKGVKNSIIVSLYLDEGEHWSSHIKSRLYELNSTRIDENFETKLDSILEEFIDKKKEELQLNDITYDIKKINNHSYSFKIIIKNNEEEPMIIEEEIEF